MIIAQISDTHIMPKGKHWKGLPETKVDERLKLIVNHLNQLNPKPDVIIHTGDTVDDCGIEGYEHLKEILEPLNMPYYLIPGNHDDREAMRLSFQHTRYMPQEGFIQYVIDDFPIRLIALDTIVPEKPHGIICEQRMNWLIKTLEANTQKPTLIFMHHPLIETGQKLLDKVKCYAPDGFEKLIERSSNIVGILSGHYHKSCASLFGRTLCFVGPSSAPVHYFEKASDEETKVIELVRPSFVLHKWLDGKRLVSETVQTVEPSNRLSVRKEP
jgi:3',5'-cyclic-AMP phosphodiesterase